MIQAKILINAIEVPGGGYRLNCQYYDSYGPVLMMSYHYCFSERFGLNFDLTTQFNKYNSKEIQFYDQNNIETEIPDLFYENYTDMNIISWGAWFGVSINFL